METLIKQLKNSQVRSLTADKGKLLYTIYELEEFGNEAQGVPNVLIPLGLDYNNIYVEKEITEEITNNNE